MQIPLALAQQGTNFIHRRYQKIFNKQLPTQGDSDTFTGKIFQSMIKMHWRDIEGITKAVDKLEVRNYVTTQIGSCYLNEVSWIGNKLEECPLHKYICGNWILKTNHGSGGHHIIKKDLLPMIRKEVEKTLARNYYYACAEPQYFFIKPKIFIERIVMGEGIGESPLMLRLWCFKGLAVLIQADDGNPVSPFYSRQWRDMKISRLGVSAPKSQIEKPTKLTEAIQVAEKLSMPFEFVRVDLYIQRDKVSFSELTFTPLAGNILFNPMDWDYKLGRIWSQRKYVL